MLCFFKIPLNKHTASGYIWKKIKIEKLKLYLMIIPPRATHHQWKSHNMLLVIVSLVSLNSAMCLLWLFMCLYSIYKYTSSASQPHNVPTCMLHSYMRVNGINPPLYPRWYILISLHMCDFVFALVCVRVLFVCSLRYSTHNRVFKSYDSLGDIKLWYISPKIIFYFDFCLPLVLDFV